MGVIQTCFLIIYDWCVIRSRSKNNHKDACLKEVGLRFQCLLVTPHSIVIINGKTYVLNYDIKKHALPITIIKSKEVKFYVC